MKVTVSFGDTNIVVPCGDGDLLIRELAEKALLRYKKFGDTAKTSQIESLRIVSLSLACDNGILDWDDKVADVLDDRELLIANYLLKSSTSPLLRDGHHNGDSTLTIDRMSASQASTGALQDPARHELSVAILSPLERIATSSTQTTVLCAPSPYRQLSVIQSGDQLLVSSPSTHSTSASSTTLQCPSEKTKLTLTNVDSEPFDDYNNASHHTDTSPWPLPPLPTPPPLPLNELRPTNLEETSFPEFNEAVNNISHDKHTLSFNQMLNQNCKPVKSSNITKEYDTFQCSSDESYLCDDDNEDYVYTSDDGTYDRRRKHMLDARKKININTDSISTAAKLKKQTMPESLLRPPLSGQNPLLPCLSSYTNPSLSSVAPLRGQLKESSLLTTVAHQEGSFSGGEEEDYPKLRADYFVRVGNARRTLIGTETSPGLLKWLDAQEQSSQPGFYQFRSQPSSTSNTFERQSNCLDHADCTGKSPKSYQLCNRPFENSSMKSTNNFLVRICSPLSSPLVSLSPHNLNIQVKPTVYNTHLHSNVGMAGDVNRREIGLEIASVFVDRSLMKEGKLQVGDRIIEINNQSLVGVPFDRGQEIFLDALRVSEILLRVTPCDKSPHQNQPNSSSNEPLYSKSHFVLPPPPSIPPPPPPIHSLPRSCSSDEPPLPPQRLTQPSIFKPKPLTEIDLQHKRDPNAESCENAIENILIHRPPPPLPRRSPNIAPKFPSRENSLQIDSLNSFNSHNFSQILNCDDNYPCSSSSVKCPPQLDVIDNIDTQNQFGLLMENKVLTCHNDSNSNGDDTIQSCSEENIETDDATEENEIMSAQFEKSSFMIQVDHEVHAIMEDSAARVQRRKDTIEEIDGISIPKPLLNSKMVTGTDILQKSTQLPLHHPTNVKRMGQKHVIELTKNSSGLGFSLTTRDNPVGGNNPVYVKKIIPGGTALQDGRLKVGDRILEIDCEDVTWRSQREIVAILREKDIGAVVELIISRQSETSSTTSFCDGATLPRRQPSTTTSNHQGDFHDTEIHQIVFNVDIQLLPIIYMHEPSTSFSTSSSSSSQKKGFNKETPRPTLGISVTGQGGSAYQEINGNFGGVYIKSLIENGAAQKDGRLKVGDQLLEINHESLCSLSSEEALSKLKTTIQKILASGENAVKLLVRRIPERTTSITTVNSAGSSGGHSVTISAEVHSQQQHAYSSDCAQPSTTAHLYQQTFCQSLYSHSDINSCRNSKPRSSENMSDASIVSTFSSSNMTLASKEQTSNSEEIHGEPVYENLSPRLNSFTANILQPIKEVSNSYLSLPTSPVSPQSPTPQPLIDPCHDVVKAGVILDNAPIDEVEAHRKMKEQRLLQQSYSKSAVIRLAVSFDDILSPEANQRWSDICHSESQSRAIIEELSKIGLIPLTNCLSISYQSQPDLLSSGNKEKFHPFARNTFARQTISAKRHRQGQLEYFTNKWKTRQNCLEKHNECVSSTILVDGIGKEVSEKFLKTAEVRRRPSIYRCDSKGTITSSSGSSIDDMNKFSSAVLHKKTGSLPSLPISPSISSFMEGRQFIPFTTLSSSGGKIPSNICINQNFSANNFTQFENINQYSLKPVSVGIEKAGSELPMTKPNRTGYNNSSFLRALHRSQSFNLAEESDDDNIKEAKGEKIRVGSEIEDKDKTKQIQEPILSFKLSEMEDTKTENKSKTKKKIKTSLRKPDKDSTFSKTLSPCQLKSSAAANTCKSKKDVSQISIFKTRGDEVRKKQHKVIRTRTKEEAKLRRKSSGFAKIFRSLARRIKQEGEIDSAGVPCIQSYYVNMPPDSSSSCRMIISPMNSSLSYNASICNQSDCTSMAGKGSGGGFVTYESSSTSSMPLSTATCSAATAPARCSAYDALSEVCAETPRSFIRKSRNVYEDAEFIYQNLSDMKLRPGLVHPTAYHHFLSQNSADSYQYQRNNFPSNISAFMSQSLNHQNTGNLFRHRQSQSVDETMSSTCCHTLNPILVKSVPCPMPSSQTTSKQTHSSAFIELKSSLGLTRPPIVNSSPANIIPDNIEPYELQGEIVKQALVKSVDHSSECNFCTYLPTNEPEHINALPLEIKKPLAQSTATPDLMNFTISSSNSPTAVPHYQVGSDLYAQVNKPTIS